MMKCNLLRKSLLPAALIAGTLTLGSGAARGQAALDTELLTNPGAEEGTPSAGGYDVVPITGWDTGGTPFTQVSYAAPDFAMPEEGRLAIGGGNAFFAGGPGAANSRAVQDVDLSALSSEIDAGGVQAILGVYMTGWATDGDNGSVVASFLDADRNPIGTEIVLGPQAGNNNQWVPYRNGVPVAPGTRAVRVSVFVQRTDGNYNDGYLDNLSLVLTRSPLPDPLPGTPTVPIGKELVVNGGAEDGAGAYDPNVVVPVPGWTAPSPFTVVEYGGPPPPGIEYAVGHVLGRNLFAGGPDNFESGASQIIDLSPYAGEIDASRLRIRFSGMLATQSAAADRAEAWIEQIDGKGRVLSTMPPIAASGTNGVPSYFTREEAIRPDARYARVVLHAVRAPDAFGGTYNGAFFDKISLTLQNGFALPAPIASAAGPVAATYDVNLLANPGAEDAAVNPNDNTVIVPIPGWTLSDLFTAVPYSAGRIREGEGARIGGGNASFSGSPGAQPFRPRPPTGPRVTTAAQTVDVSAFAADIDAGVVHARAEAQMGTYFSDGDNGEVRVTFLDSSLAPLGEAVLGPVTATGGAYQLVSADRPVPPGARGIQVMLISQRVSGGTHDAQFDNLSLSLYRGASTLPGDTNGDGTIDVGDAALAIRAAVGLPGLSPAQMERADADRDGAVTTGDVILILRRVAGLG